MKKSTIFLFSFIFLSSLVFGQKGKNEYLSAKKSYESGNFSNSLQQLKQVETILGETNAVIEHLRVKCYFELKKYKESNNALVEFYKYPFSAALLKEMQVYKKKILLADVSEPLKDLKRQQLELINQIEIRIKYVNLKINQKAIEIKQFTKNGTAQYKEAMDKGSLAALEGFLVAYPNSIYVDSVRNKLIPLLKEKREKDVDTSAIFKQTMPYYPGGASAYRSFLISNFEYPEKARRAGIQGKVYVQFVINSDGAITEPKVIRGIGGGCDEVALKIIKKMPNWIPATVNGKNVSIKQIQVISFVLQ